MLTLSMSDGRQQMDYGIPREYVEQALAAGIDTTVLWKLLLQHGPALLEILAQLFGWKVPPLPPLPLCLLAQSPRVPL